MEHESSQQLALLFYRVNRSFQHLMAMNMKPFDITPEQWNVLEHLQEKDGLTQKDLSNIAEKDKTTITRIIDSLEHKGALRRQVNPSDRRSFRIILTDEGRSMIQHIQPIPDKVNLQASRSLSHEELASLKQMLHDLQKQINLEIELIEQDKVSE